MKIFLLVVGFAVAVLAEEPAFTDYIEERGIPAAREIRLAESAMDSGASRIIGGSISSLGEFPYFGGLLVDLTDGRQSVCGSSLLTSTKAVTAAHCWNTNRFQGRQVTVVLGSLRLYSGGTRITTSKVEVHENWDTRLKRNDIAMITIDHVDFSDNISPVALATGSDDYVGVTAMVVGFGKTGDYNAITKEQVLRNVTMKVISNTDCKRAYGRYVTDNNICTDTTRGTKATCSGDSGGPLTVGSGDDTVLIGIVSFGLKSCSARGPKALTRVTSFASWINERI